MIAPANLTFRKMGKKVYVIQNQRSFSRESLSNFAPVIFKDLCKSVLHTHNIVHIAIIANFVFPHICSSLHYLHHITLVNEKLETLWVKEHWRIQEGGRQGRTPPLGVQILSFSCSFLQKFEK